MIVTTEYSTPIGTYELEDSTEMNKGLCDFLYSIRDKEKGSNLQYSMAGPNGYHTKDDLLSRNNPFMEMFHKKVSEQIVTYYEAITGRVIGPNTKMVSWGMIYSAGDYSKTHTHPLADIATAYYCKVPKGLAGEDGAFHHIDPRPAGRWDTNFTDSSMNFVPAKESTGAIFPGWLEHYVTPHFLEEDRICIATNVFIDHGTFFK